MTEPSAKIEDVLEELRSDARFRDLELHFILDQAEDASDGVYIPYTVGRFPESANKFERLIGEIEDIVQERTGESVSLYLSPDAHAA